MSTVNPDFFQGLLSGKYVLFVNTFQKFSDGRYFDICQIGGDFLLLVEWVFFILWGTDTAFGFRIVLILLCEAASDGSLGVFSFVFRVRSSWGAHCSPGRFWSYPSLMNLLLSIGFLDSGSPSHATTFPRIIVWRLMSSLVISTSISLHAGSVSRKDPGIFVK